MTNVEGRGIPRERDGPAQTEEQIAMEAIDVVIRSWFNGAEDGWPKLHDYERKLIAEEILARFSQDGLELRALSC